jgi:monoamine oxidase
MAPPHTIIVGGGIAGLWLALQLAHQGDRVTVLEKYDYLGGRVITSKKYHVEIGAGRIHEDHKRVGALVDHYHLTRIPLGDTMAWISAGGTPEPNDFESTWAAICDRVALLPPSVLSTHTLRELATKIMGTRAADALLERFPYRAELNVLRADLGLQTFRAGGDMGTRAGYYVVREGLSTLINRLATACRRAGVTLRTGMEVTGIDGTTVHIKGRAASARGDRVILATHVNALRTLLPSPLWSHLAMAPLTRIYAQYPTPAWFADLPKFATDSPLRYVIPIDPARGVIMISYTDGDDTRWWRGLKNGGLQRAIQSELRVLFPERDIPDPVWIKSFEWDEAGCTYWVPGDYNPATVAAQMMNPAPNVYVCGESLSVGHQAWMEGALETAEMLYRNHLSSDV